MVSLVNNQESIFKASLRYFFISIFTILGISFGFILLILGVALFEEVEVSPDRTFKMHVLADETGKRTTHLTQSPVILQLNIEGVIGLNNLTADDIRQQLIESQEGDLKHEHVKAILLYINTPGGTVTDADGIYRAVMQYKQRYGVPVYAYVDGMCASGGVYVAMAADKIFASDISLVGSVGVIISPFMNFSQLIEKVGVQSKTLYAGIGKDEMNSLRPWKEDEAAPLQAIVDSYYNDFVNLVVRHRPEITKEKLVGDYGAHVFPAPEAKEKGYIDQIDNSRENVVMLLARHVNLEAGDYEVVTLKHKKWLSELLSSNSALITGTVKHQLDVGMDLDPKLLNKHLYLYRPGE